MPNSILLVDDDVALLRSIGTFFERNRWDVFSETTGEAALATAARIIPDVTLLDLHLPGMDGLDVLEQLRARGSAVIMLTGEADVESAVRAMQLGAENFLLKPVDLPHLLEAAKRAEEKVRLRRLNRSLIGRGAVSGGLESLGGSGVMRQLADQVSSLARSDRTAIAVVGETGTGRHTVARLIHDTSNRASEAYVEFSARGADPAWVDEQLFGRDGPDTLRQRGLIELADRGTLLLDDVETLPLPTQAKIVSVLANRSFRRIGGEREIPVDVRIAALACAPLADSVAAGHLRADFASRFDAMPLMVPPLRDRSREDVVGLIRGFLHQFGAGVTGAPTRVSDDAFERLMAHRWPGNVAEMRNVLERAMLLAQGQPVVGIEHLPGEFRSRPGPFDRRHTPLTMDEVERMHIDRTLKHHAGNRSRAAIELGISRATLIAKIKRYAIPG